MTDLKNKTEEIVETVTDEAEHLAHNIAHPEDETRKEAKARQPWMPIIGAIVAALILFLAYAFFYR